MDPVKYKPTCETMLAWIYNSRGFGMDDVLWAQFAKFCEGLPEIMMQDPLTNPKFRNYILGK